MVLAFLILLILWISILDDQIVYRMFPGGIRYSTLFACLFIYGNYVSDGAYHDNMIYLYIKKMVNIHSNLELDGKKYTNKYFLTSPILINCRVKNNLEVTII